jgi:hypothetical protein
MSRSGAQWRWLYLASVLLACGFVGLAEWHYRRRLRSAGDRGVALLGTSRMLFGVDPKRLKARLPGYQPIMLAINGEYPMAALRDLAADNSFRGVVVVDTDAAGLRLLYREMQQPHVAHFRAGFGPSRALHRRILTQWQRRMVVADPSYGLISAIQRRLFQQPPPQVRYVNVAPNRAGALDFGLIDPAPLAAHFAQMQWDGLKLVPPPPPQQWLAELAPVALWVKQIQARGGKVLFFSTPTSGEHRRADDAGYPRDLYWDKAASVLGAPMVCADDVPLLRGIPTKDGSHVDQRDRDRLTDGLAIAIHEKLHL